MKSKNFLSNLWSLLVGSRKDNGSARLRVDYDSFTCRLRVWPLKLVAVLAILLTLGIGNAWGATATFTASEKGWSGTSTKTQTVSGVTFSFAKGKTDPTYYDSDGLRTYEGCVITISSSNTITGIKFTYTVSNNGYLKKFNTGTWTSGTTTWSGSATSINCTVGHSSGSKNGQVRITEIVVTYIPSAASHTLSSAVSPAASGSVELSATSVAEGSTATATATPAAHYVFNNWSISGTGASLSSNTTNPTTVTMGTADATVTATFVAAPKASVTLSEAGATTTDATTYYVGDSYTLPSSTGASCGTKVLVGWSTETVSETDTKPASNFYEKGEIVTLEASQTFYAVFATASGGGGGEPTAYTAGDEGTYVLAIYVSDKWYALPAKLTDSSGKISGGKITVSNTGGVDYVTSANASGYEWTIANATNGQTISDGSKYIYHSNGGASGTNLTYGTNTSYTWKIEKEDNGLTFKGMSGSTTNSRGLLANGTTFGGYSLTNEDESGYYRIHVLPIGGGTTYSAYSTSCEACANNVTVSYTAAPTGGTVAVTNGGAAVAAGSTVKTCTGGASLVVTVTPSTHYSVSSVTFTPSAGLVAGDLSGTSTPASTTAGVWTYNVTIAEDAAGTLTIAPTFTEDAHVAINWNVNGVNQVIAATEGLTWVYSGGDITALPSTPANNTLDACIGSGKGRFMGWSPTKVMPAQDVVPEGMFNEVEYAPEITDDVTFYAVFAEEKAGSFAATNKTYTFTSNAWADDESAWTGSKNGNSKTHQGVQICTSQSGVTVTSKSSYDDVTKVTVTYSTNAKAGAGSISIKVNGTAYTASASVSSTDGTSDRTIDFTPPSSASDGVVVLTVTCSTNSIYIKSVQIFYTGSTTTYSDYRTACCDDPQLTFGTIASPVTEYVIVREDLASASAGVEIDCNFESNNTSEDITWYSTHRDKNDYVGAYTWTSSQPTDRLEITNKKIIAKETGSWQITIAQAMGSTNYCDETATVNIIVKTVDKFIDNVNGNFSGEAQRLEDTGNGIVLPTAETFSTDNGCADGTTRRLLGWIKASDLATYASGRRVDMIDNLKTSDSATNKVIAPGTKVQAMGVTWYAVWGVEK